MPSHYSRQDKSRSQNTIRPTKHIKTGLTAFQKSIAFIGSILSIIVPVSRFTKPYIRNQTKAQKIQAHSQHLPLSKLLKKTALGSNHLKLKQIQHSLVALSQQHLHPNQHHQPPVLLKIVKHLQRVHNRVLLVQQAPHKRKTFHLKGLFNAW